MDPAITHNRKLVDYETTDSSAGASTGPQILFESTTSSFLTNVNSYCLSVAKEASEVVNADHYHLW